MFILDTNPTGFKKGEWMFNEPDNSEMLYQFDYDIEQYPLGNKVIAHLPINGSPELNKVLLLPELPEPYGKELKTRYASQTDDMPNFAIAGIEGLAKLERSKPASYSAEEMNAAMDEMFQWCLDASQYDDKSGKAMILDKITRAKYPTSFVAEMKNNKFITYKNSIGCSIVKGDWIK